jgi:FkbH-like protein
MNMKSRLDYPFDAGYLLRKKKLIRRELLSKKDLIEKKIAILGGSTTAEVKDMIELFLLNDGIKPVFYESDYNRYYEDVMFTNEALKEFAPDIIYIHTSAVNITRFPTITESGDDILKLVAGETKKFTEIWNRITSDYSCPVIQNNFELPHYRPLGNLDAYDIHGRTAFIAALNFRFSEEARLRKNLYLNDINYLAAWFGLEKWYDKQAWNSYKYGMSMDAIPLLANSVASVIRATYGKTKKCMVLDLDNTLWGGVIGDDGVNGISIGKETPEAEAYTEFQEYIKSLKERGVILAVCSKNDDAMAREGFAHPDTVLVADDFSAFLANWEPKHENIRNIAIQLNIGIDSLVFADDNPVERDIVRSQEPQVSVPELGNITTYINIIDKAGFFEPVSLSTDDIQRNTYYAGNATRQEVQHRFENYDDFLESLDMTAEIKTFAPVYLERITQLTNKTNQFNVTTRRYTFTEIENIANDDNYIKLYGRLIDKFGDNGLVSVMVGVVRGQELHIDLWLMSCRVLKRSMEEAMLDQLVAVAKSRGIKKIIGYYYPTAKNGMVSGLFKEMGFTNKEAGDNSNVWSLDISSNYINKNKLISINDDTRKN